MRYSYYEYVIAQFSQQYLDELRLVPLVVDVEGTMQIVLVPEL
jgi:hypothetical protein